MQKPPHIILQDKPSASEIPVYWGSMGTGLAVCFFFIAQLVSPIALFRNIFLFFSLASIVLALLRILIDLAEREVSLYTLTDDCLTVRRGFNQRINTIPVEHIQQILVSKPILGRILNYGTLIVKAPGFSFLKITRVPNPDKWQSRILEFRHIH